MPVGDASAAFATAQERWSRRISEAQSEADTFGRSSSGALNKRARWAAKGEQFMRGTGIKVDPESMVLPDPRLRGNIIALLNKVFPAVSQSMERNMVPVAVEAFDRWPVGTGLSKSLMDLRYFQPTDTQFGTMISNFAPYAIFIHSGGPWRDSILGPGGQAADRIAHDIGQGVA